MKTFKIVGFVVIAVLAVILIAALIVLFAKPVIAPQAPGVSDIEIASPQPGQAVSEPVMIQGKARGNWYFEAVFPVELVDAAGKVLGRGQAMAQSEWTTNNFVPFKAVINYELSATSTGKLIFRNDNPSGLPEKQKQLELPVVISPSQTMVVRAFFSNNQFDPQVSCNKVFAVTRQVPASPATARAALNQLLAGPTVAERARGYYTSINPGVKIRKLTIAKGVARVDFDETLEKAVGGSCRVSAIRAQITKTLTQFSSVKSVIISINGRTEDILQP